MTVFKHYFSIVKQHLGIIIMFSAIAIGISMVNTSYQTDNDYLSVKSRVAVINRDDSKLVDNYIELLGKNAEIKEIDDDEKTFQDALFDNKVDAIFIIDKDFTKKFLNGENPTVEIKRAAQSISESAELITNKYFQIANIYKKIGMSEDEIITHINEDMSKEVTVTISNKTDVLSLNKIALFYTFENYAFISIFILVVGTIMCIFNKEVINKRNQISSTKPKNISKQLFLGHISLTLLIWLIYIIISVIIYGDLMFTKNALLMIVNSLIFAITCTSMAFLIGNLIKNQNVISGIQNILSIGLSFISGCFIYPLDMLDKSVVTIAKFFPSYWFIDSNYALAKVSTFDFETLKPIYTNMLIVLSFGIIYYIISLIIIKKKASK